MTTNLVEAGGFFRMRQDLSTPDVETAVTPDMATEDSLGVASGHGYTLFSEILRPSSVGKMALCSADPTAKPRIFHNHFATEDDRAAVREGIRINMRIAKCDSLREYELRRAQYPVSDANEELDRYVGR